MHSVELVVPLLSVTATLILYTPESNNEGPLVNSTYGPTPPETPPVPLAETDVLSCWLLYEVLVSDPVGNAVVSVTVQE